MSEPAQKAEIAGSERTPLYDLHVENGGKMAPFAGYSMPMQFRGGIIAEHTHTRARAGLFDVSHMGQAWLRGACDIAAAMERLVPGELHVPSAIPPSKPIILLVVLGWNCS